MAYKGNINKVILKGGLKEVPQVYETKKGKAATIYLATKYPGKNIETGEHEDRTEWHRVVLYGRHAESVVRIGKPGMEFYVEGPKRMRNVVLNDGSEKQICEVIAYEFDPMQPIKKNKDLENDGDESTSEVGTEGYVIES